MDINGGMLMKKNPNKNVLTDFPFRPRYYLLHPWKFVRACWHNLQNAWFRVTRGIAPVDLWSFDTHLENIIPYGLRWLAENSHGWPQSEEFPEFKDWANYLYDLADKWDYAFKDWIEYSKENEYYKEYQTIMKKCSKHEKGEDGLSSHWIEKTPEYTAIYEKYRARDEQIIQKYKDLQHECFVLTEHIWHSLWD